MTYELCYFLLPSVCFSRLQTLGCGTDVQQHQARGAGIPEWVLRGPAGCLTRWLHCPLPGDLHHSKQLRKILLPAHGIWFPGGGRTTESLRFRKGLKNTSVSLPVQQSTWLKWFIEVPCKPLALQSVCLSAFLNWIPKRGKAVALQLIYWKGGREIYILSWPYYRRATRYWVSHLSTLLRCLLLQRRWRWQCLLQRGAGLLNLSPGIMVLSTLPDTTQGDSASLTHIVGSD